MKTYVLASVFALSMLMFPAAPASDAAFDKAANAMAGVDAAEAGPSKTGTAEQGATLIAPPGSAVDHAEGVLFGAAACMGIGLWFYHLQHEDRKYGYDKRTPTAS